MKLKEMMVTGWFIQLRPDLAAALGMDKAIIFQCLYTLLEQPGNGKEVGGNRWIFNTYEQWQLRYFKFYSVSAIKRAFIELEKMGLIESCTPEGRMARRKYYRIPGGALEKAFSAAPKRDRTKSKRRKSPSCSKSTMVVQLESVPITYIPPIENSEKKCPLPSQARSEDEVSFSLDERLRIVTNLFNTQNEAVRRTLPSAGERECSANSNEHIYGRRLPKTKRLLPPSINWLARFCDVYDPPWDSQEILDYFSEEKRTITWRQILDAEKFLIAFFEKIENDRTKPKPN